LNDFAATSLRETIAMISNNDKGVPSQILVSHYLFERRNELDLLTNVYSRVKDEKKGVKSGGKMKRPIGRLHHRTRSHKSYKLQRKKMNLKRKLSKPTSTSVGNMSTKKKCRKQLRRVITLIFDNRRTPTKLATHRWHAKRMEMASFYGYSLAFRSRQRGIKSVERIVKSKAVLHDSCYYRPIKICCSHSQLLAFLENHSVSVFYFGVFPSSLNG
jgi:hypothetical protein